MCRWTFQANNIGNEWHAELCKTSEYLSPEEKEVELFPIAIQELYVLIRQGKFESAEVLVKEISFNQ